MDAARTQKLTALAIGFYQGSRIKVGQTFEFEGDKPRSGRPRQAR